MEKNQVSINKKMCTKRKNTNVSGDIIVPDIKPDILNIIDTNGTSYIYKQEIINGKLRVDGALNLNVVYMSMTGEIRSINNIIQFFEIFDDINYKDESSIEILDNIEMIDAKVLNERKIQVNAEISIIANVYNQENLEYISSLDEQFNFELLSKKINVKTLKDSKMVKANLKESIMLEQPQSEEKVFEIVKCDYSLSNIENKSSYNKILSKADCSIKIVYTTDKMHVKVREEKFPVTCFIDVDKVSENDTYKIEYKVKNVVFKLDNQNGNQLEIQMDFDVNCKIFSREEIDFIQDIYSLKDDVMVSQKDVSVEVCSEGEEKIQVINDVVLVNDIISIYDVTVTPKVINYDSSEKINNCQMNLKILYESDTNNDINVKIVPIAFKIKSEELLDSNSIIIINKDFKVLNSNNVECSISYKLSNNSDEFETIKIIDDFEINEDVSNSNDYKMVMYFVRKGDTIWNIAKKFKVKMDTIIKINELDNPDKLVVGDRLYIMK